MEATLQGIQDILSEKFELDATAALDMSFEDVGLDSLEIINFLFSVEEAYNVKIPDTVITNKTIETIGQLIDFVNENQ